MPGIETRLSSTAPIYDFMEISRIESHLAFSAEVLGAEHPTIRMLLAGKSPRDRAIDLVSGTGLFKAPDMKAAVEEFRVVGKE